MSIAVTILIILAAILIVVVIRHTKGKDYTPEKPKVADEHMTLEQAKELYEDGQLTTRAGYLHYNLSEAYEADDNALGVFTGYVKPDAQHDGNLLVFDDDGLLRGKITDQKDYYAKLLNRRKANCYGFVVKKDNSYTGEVCVRNI